MQKAAREYMQILETHGVKVLATRRSKHTILKCLGPAGNHFNLAIPSSPSDRRGLKNFKSEVSTHCTKSITLGS